MDINKITAFCTVDTLSMSDSDDDCGLFAHDAILRKGRTQENQVEDEEFDTLLFEHDRSCSSQLAVTRLVAPVSIKPGRGRPPTSPPRHGDTLEVVKKKEALFRRRARDQERKNEMQMLDEYKANVQQENFTKADELHNNCLVRRLGERRFRLLARLQWNWNLPRS